MRILTTIKSSNNQRRLEGAAQKTKDMARRRRRTKRTSSWSWWRLHLASRITASRHHGISWRLKSCLKIHDGGSVSGRHARQIWNPIFVTLLDSARVLSLETVFQNVLFLIEWYDTTSLRNVHFVYISVKANCIPTISTVADPGIMPSHLLVSTLRVLGTGSIYKGECGNSHDLRTYGQTLSWQTKDRQTSRFPVRVLILVSLPIRNYKFNIYFNTFNI